MNESSFRCAFFGSPSSRDPKWNPEPAAELFEVLAEIAPRFIAWSEAFEQ